MSIHTTGLAPVKTRVSPLCFDPIQVEVGKSTHIRGFKHEQRLRKGRIAAAPHLLSLPLPLGVSLEAMQPGNKPSSIVAHCRLRGYLHVEARRRDEASAAQAADWLALLIVFVLDDRFGRNAACRPGPRRAGGVMMMFGSEVVASCNAASATGDSPGYMRFSFG